jgi:hypothetical protein
MLFKVKHGFDNQDFIRIDESELEKAIYAQMTGKVAVLNGGTVRGSNIISITPDLHRAMGYNDGYELVAEDFAEIRNSGIENKARECFEEKKSKVYELIANKQEHLIGKQNDTKQLT